MAEEILGSFAFGNSPEIANDRARKVAEGKKTATSSPYFSDGCRANDFLQVGGRYVILDGAGKAVAEIQAVDLAVRAFLEVDCDHALSEGYSSLLEWRKFKESMFRKEGFFHDGLLIACQQFRLVKVFER